MEEQKRLPVRIDLEEFAEAITRGVLRAAAQRSELSTGEVETQLIINPMIRLGIWIDISREIRGTKILGGPEILQTAESSGGIQQ